MQKWAERDPVEGGKALRAMEPGTVVPIAAAAVAAFAVLNATRGEGLVSAGRITLQDIAAYRDTFGVVLDPHEVAWVVSMDDATRDELEQRQAARDADEDDRPKGRSATP